MLAVLEGGCLSFVEGVAVVLVGVASLAEVASDSCGGGGGGGFFGTCGCGSTGRTSFK